jgi:hypothetical protein
MASTWGEPEIGNSSPMQGPAQISAVADYAMGIGIRHFATQAALVAASGAVDDYYAVVTAIPGALWRYYTGTGWRMLSTAHFVDDAAATAITSPHQRMRRRIATKMYDEEYFAAYNASTNPTGKGSAGWYPVAIGVVPIIPTGTTGSVGTGVGIRGDGGVNVVAASTIGVQGAFPTDFESFEIVWDFDQSVAGGLKIQLTSGGTASTTLYDHQQNVGNGTATSQSYQTVNDTGFVLTSGGGQGQSGSARLYNPSQARFTRLKAESVSHNTGTGSVFESGVAGGHKVASIYDGFLITTTAGTVTGHLSVRGLTVRF